MMGRCASTGRRDSGSSPRRLGLPGGRTLTIRPSSPGDADALTQMYASLDDDDLYRRFFQAHVPTARTIARILSAAERGGVGLVAVLEDRDRSVRIVGETSYEMLPGGGAELGITVAAGSRGWLGPYLLDALVEAARVRGVTSLEADVLLENRRMLALMRARGYATMDHSERPSIVRVVIGTESRTPPWPGTHHGARVLVEATRRSLAWRERGSGRRVRGARLPRAPCPHALPGAGR